MDVHICKCCFEINFIHAFKVGCNGISIGVQYLFDYCLVVMNFSTTISLIINLDMNRICLYLYSLAAPEQDRCMGEEGVQRGDFYC